MKMLLATHHFLPCIGGIESYVNDECRYLNKHGIETEVIALNKCSESPARRLPAEGTIEGIRVHRVPFLRLGPLVIAPSILGHAMRKDIDAIHCHAMGFFLDFLVLTRPLHRKKIFLSTNGGIFHTKKHGFLKKLYFNAWARLILMGVDKTIAISGNDLETFSAITKNIVLIEDSFDGDRVNSLGRKGKEKNSFLFVGRLFRNKRTDLLLRAFAELKGVEPNFRLYLVGPDWGEEGKLRALAKELSLGNNASFEGGKDRAALNAYYDKCEFVVSASEYEGFGISVIESMAARCIPVINDIPTFRNFVGHGKNGYIADYTMPAHAAKTLARAIGLTPPQRRKLSEAAHNSVQRYSWEQAAKKLVSLFSQK